MMWMYGPTASGRTAMRDSAICSSMPVPSRMPRNIAAARMTPAMDSAVGAWRRSTSL